MSFIKHHIDANTKEYRPVFPKKYGGEYPILVRSEWERAFMQWCDMNPSVVLWASETTEIPYFNPVRKRQARYYPDFLIKVKDKDGREKTYMVEIKPYKEIHPPRASKTKSMKSNMYEAATYMTNMAKWKAAEDYCKKHNMTFRILTERELFVESKKK